LLVGCCVVVRRPISSSSQKKCFIVPHRNPNTRAQWNVHVKMCMSWLKCAFRDWFLLEVVSVKCACTYTFHLSQENYVKLILHKSDIKIKWHLELEMGWYCRSCTIDFTWILHGS
jgi:hypothetical protein